MNDTLLIERDRKVIWHPFTQHQIDTEILPVVASRGAWLELEDGSHVLDAISSWFVNIHGHAHPKIASAIYQQAMRFEHAIFARFTHEPAVKLAELLINAMQSRGLTLSRCFYSDNGSTAVEAALKMTFQYHKNRGDDKRIRFIALHGSYHGDTIGSMSVSTRNHFNRYFNELMPDVDYVKPDDIATLKKLLSAKPQQHAAMIIEPMIQGVVGMQMHSAEFLREVAEICKNEHILLIADEAFTGFYRTGKAFAFEHAGIKPDLICLAKGITGGSLPLSATLTTETIFNGFLSDDVGRAFLHGHSYTANPIACAAAIASWELLHTPQTQQAIMRISNKTRDCILRLAKHPRVANARCIGTIGAVDIRNCPDYFSGFSRKIASNALKQGVLLRPFGEVVYAVPPYCVTDAEIDRIYKTIENVLDNLEILNENSVAENC